MKRILLFVATNLAIMVTVSIVLTILGIGGYRLPGGGLDYSALMVFCLIWGMAGSFISLALSRFMAKQAMGVQLVDGRTGHEELDWLHATVRQRFLYSLWITSEIFGTSRPRPPPEWKCSTTTPRPSVPSSFSSSGMARRRVSAVM